MIEVRAKGERRAEMTVYGPVGEGIFTEGVKAEKVREDIKAMGDVTDIDVFINSPGGNVWDGLAIANMLAAHPAQVHVHVEGLAASIASVIACAGDLITMGMGAQMMLHAPSGMFVGNADEMRKYADVLDQVENGMLDIYQARTGTSREDLAAILKAETWFSGEEAVSAKLADTFIAGKARPTAHASWRAVMNCFRNTPSAFEPHQQPAHSARFTEVESMTAGIKVCGIMAGASLARALNSAIDSMESDDQSRADIIERMGRAAGISAGTVNQILNQEINCPPIERLRGFASVLNGVTLSSLVSAAESDGCEYGEGNDSEQSARADAPSQEKSMTIEAPASVPDTDTNAAVAAERARASDIQSACIKFGMPGEFAAKAIADGIAVADLNARILEQKFKETSGRTVPHPDLTEDEHDKMRAAASDWLVARAGLGKVDGSNPFRGMTIENVARDVLEHNGVRTRGMGREAVIKAAITHSTSDFPNIFENALHKSMLGAFDLAAPVWNRVARTSSLSDFRPHLRFRPGSFSDLLPVNENGEYQDGTMGDAQRETIQAIRKGRILNVSREMLINDDMSVFTDVATYLGQAAARAPDKDLIALFGSNGPTMSDTNPLFHADHGNIAGTPAAPTIDAFEAGRVQMASQMDPSGNDYLDLRPAIWLGPMSVGGQARSTNAAEYNDESQRNQRRPNISRGLVRDIVDTRRLSGTAWYLLADPAVAPVFEVGFLDGVQVPQLEMEEAFRSDGISWRIRYEYGVAAIDWRGIVRNAGA